MKLVSSVGGRATQTFSPDEVRGERTTHIPEVVQAMQEKYDFTNHTDLKQAGTAGMKFERGRLKLNNDEIWIENFDVYNDGFIAVCRSTDDADTVLNDAIEWAVERFGMRRPARWPLRTHTSWLVVDFEEAAASIVAKFSKIQKLIKSSYQEAYGNELPFDLARIAFNVDPKLVPQYTNTEFSIDRRGGEAYAANRFFCMAPLKTRAHLELLGKLDTVLAEKS